MIADYTPSVDDLATLIPARAAARFTGGAGTPAFPDTDRVEAVIQDAVGLVAPALGGDELDEQFWPGAKALVKLQTALILEPAAWPEQARPDKSAFEQWLSMLNTSMDRLTTAVVRFRDDEDDGPGASQGVISSFPPPGLQAAMPVNILGEPIYGTPCGLYGTVDW